MGREQRSQKKFQKKKNREKRVQAGRVQEIRRTGAGEHHYRGELFFREGDLGRAGASFLKAVETDPAFVEAYRSLTIVAVRQNDLTQAVRWLRKILELDPADREAKFHMGRVLVTRGELEEGAAFLELYLREEKRRTAPVKALKESARSVLKSLRGRSPSRKKKAAAGGRSEAPPATAESPAVKDETPVDRPEGEDPTGTRQDALAEAPPALDLSMFQDPRHLKDKPEWRLSFPEDRFFQEADRESQPLEDYDLLLRFHHLSLLQGFDDLLCLAHLRDVDKYWYQVETVANTLKRFEGRVLLADEVGLGKTIEAGMVLKEYLLRGMVKKILVLVPPSLVSQWREEMENKFGIPFDTTDDPDFRREGPAFWQRRDRVIASLHLAKSSKHFEVITAIPYDLVIVDEAHVLRNRNTLNYRLVNALRKRFILLLSATPVQNNLLELYNLINILKPGTLKTEAAFKREYVKRGNLRVPENAERLQQLLRNVMIRNTRAMVDVKLPRRYATTFYLEAPEKERRVYDEITGLVRDRFRAAPEEGVFALTALQMTAGSSPFALQEGLFNYGARRPDLAAAHREAVTRILGIIETLEETAKGLKLLSLLDGRRDKAVVFVRYRKTLDYVAGLLEDAAIPCAVFHGGLASRDKEAAVQAFREEVPVLLSTESGGEGRNLQFCNTMINFDIPWNPMRLEQRIGRIHRIGQKRDVFVFNLCVAGTVEDYMMKILDEKIHMFELVIGEIDSIIGNMDSDREFGGLIMDLWLQSESDDEAKKNFDHLGREIVKAKEAYEKTKALDEALFGRDYEV